MQELQNSLDLCTFCPRLCSDRCPVSLVEARDTVTPQAKMASYGRLRAHVEPWTPAGTAPLYACSGCGACTTACLHGVEPGLQLMHGRAQAQDHAAEHPALHGLVPEERRRTEAVGAALRAAGYGRTISEADAAGEERAHGPRTAYLPSCQGGEAAAVVDARRALRVLQAVADPGETAADVLTQGCGGYALYAGGQVEPFRLYAESFAQAAAGYDTVLTSCALCAWLLREQYPAHGVPLRGRVRHISEQIAPRAGRLAVTQPLPQAVYHDPCHLGRRLGIYDEPRQLLQRAVARPLEFADRREMAGCCGAGGLMPRTAPDTAREMARERLAGLDEATDAAAGDPRVVVTACGACQQQLAEAAAPGTRVVDLLTLLDEALG